MATYSDSFNAKHILNRSLNRHGITERVVQGRGYVYFVEGDASGWTSSSIPVCWMRDLDADSVVWWWKVLSKNASTPKEIEDAERSPDKRRYKLEVREASSKWSWGTTGWRWPNADGHKELHMPKSIAEARKEYEEMNGVHNIKLVEVK